MPPRATRLCATHNLAYDPEVADGCVLCRRSVAPPVEPRPAAARPRTSSPPPRIMLVIALAVAAAGAYFLVPRGGATGPGHDRPIVAHTVTRRTGAAYVPSWTGPRPLLVVLHGSGHDGSSMVRQFQALSDRYGFVVVAPDSVRAEGWEVGDRPGEVTADRRHVMDVVREILADSALSIDREHVLLAGLSAGGSSAPAIASWEEPFTAFAILHGGVIPNSFGPRRVRGWLSTGTSDAVRSAAQVQAAATTLRAVGLEDLSVETFPGATPSSTRS
jgi:poly(3-hydroxybutyrate) depolymerase